MDNDSSDFKQSELFKRLQVLMLLRVAFVSLILGAYIFIEIKESQAYFGDIQTFHYLLIFLVYFFTFLYSIYLKLSKKIIWFTYFQLFNDTLLITAIIYTTGGIESIFSFLYILTIINGSILLYRRGGLFIASCSSILYGLLLDLHYYGIIHPLGNMVTYAEEYQNFYLFYLILVNILGFYIVAYLSSYLSEQIRKGKVALNAKQIDFQKLEALNESIIRSVTVALIALDGSKKIILHNPAAESIFGIRKIDCEGQYIDKILPFTSKYLNDTDFTSFIDLPYKCAKGKKIHLRLSLSPLKLSLEEDHDGYILIFQDISRIKEIEGEMKKVEGLALIGGFAAGIAHEVRNPLAAISGSIQILKDGLRINDVNKRLMDIISREISRLNHLVNDFLLFAKPKNINLQFFDLNKLIIEALELLRNNQDLSRNIQIVKSLSQPIKMQSDPEQIQQILWNLFINASEAMPKGGSLFITTKLESDKKDTIKKRVQIIVRDTGEGFDEEIRDQLFTPFFTTKEGGSGLGLAIVKRIVEGLQGQLFGVNDPSGGAKLTIILPISS